jgi:hypothetical protein
MSGELSVPDAGRAERVGELPPGGAPDWEVANIMDELDGLQRWMLTMTIQQRGAAQPRQAMDLIQRVRCLIVERTYPDAIKAKAERQRDA